MGIIQCARGHFYDDRKNKSCPYCEQIREEESVTVRMDASSIAASPVSVVHMEGQSYEGTVDNEKTVSLFSKSRGNDFVTGWIVCVSGPEKGRPYSLYNGFNKIGRSLGMDIYLEEDRQISRDYHCAVVYEYNRNVFYLVPHDGNLVYLNGEFLDNPTALTTGDVFKIGSSEFEFIAFCRGERKWQKENMEG